MKNLIYIFLAVVSILATTMEGLGQQDPMFTQYFFNPLTVNSGYAGTRDALNENTDSNYSLTTKE